MCFSAVEDLEHTFTGCSSTKEVSAHLTNWVDWWPKNAVLDQGIWSTVSTNKGEKFRNQVRKVIVAAFLWTIWSQRNRKVFKGSIKNAKETFCEVQFLAFDWLRCRSKFGKFLTWESWVCNPVETAVSCNFLASR